MNRTQTLQRAVDAVKDRGEDYGPIKENFQRIADFWATWLIHRGIISDPLLIEPLDVAMMNDLQKTSRLIETPDHEDSIVDKAGYAACYAECATPQPQPKEATE